MKQNNSKALVKIYREVSKKEFRVKEKSQWGRPFR